ncbi:unnamed protein product [Soboliphyme baturini]|uniref:GAGA-binding transcriptional activator n=1 Tax=Soboliphyme baturini TaxID=241478 RepID=A0A183IIQ9_9BILA|nr:unnamed protein product [Soboliphyme baturini]
MRKVVARGGVKLQKTCRYCSIAGQEVKPANGLIKRTAGGVKRRKKLFQTDDLREDESGTHALAMFNLLFVGWKNVLSAVDYKSLWTVLVEQGVDTSCINLLKEANSGCCTNNTLLVVRYPDRIPVAKGIKRGQSSFKVFTPSKNIPARSSPALPSTAQAGGRLRQMRKVADQNLLIALCQAGAWQHNDA